MNSSPTVDPVKSTASEDSEGFHVQGRVTEPTHFSLSQLRRMDQVTIGDLPMICGSGEPKGQLGTCRGVLLADVLNNSPVITTAHNDTKRMYIVAASADGYATVFSWQEIFNTQVGEGVMVLLEKEGAPVHGGHGPVDLISARDHLSGPRYVKRLATVSVRILD